MGAPRGEELERHRRLKGWAFSTRTPEQSAAAQKYLDTGEVTDDMHPDDKKAATDLPVDRERDKQFDLWVKTAPGRTAAQEARKYLLKAAGVFYEHGLPRTGEKYRALADQIPKAY